MDSSIQSADQPPDLTDRITRTSKYSTAGGGFGDIWECLLHTGANQVMVRPPHAVDQHLHRSFQVAVKVIRPQADEVDEKVSYNITILTYVLTGCAIQALRRELGMWKRVHHANILPLLGIARDFGVYISMVSPWLEKGSLTMYLRAHKDLGLSDRHRLVSFWTIRQSFY
jgi:hypothetical protein